MSVTLRFCGAARTVTGSCYLFETPAGRLLVDCGLFQGPKTLKALNYGAFPFRPADIDTRAADPRAYRSQRPDAEADARRLSRADLGDARHHRPVLLSCCPTPAASRNRR